MISPDVLHVLGQLGFAMLGFVSIFFLGFWFGFNKGIRQHGCFCDSYSEKTFCDEHKKETTPND